MTEQRLEERIAEALEKLGFFIGQRGLDDPTEVAKVINQAGLGAVLVQRYIDRGHVFYLVEPNTRPCLSECSLKCRGEGEECRKHCTSECSRKLLGRAVEALRNARRGRAGTRRANAIHSG